MQTLLELFPFIHDTMLELEKQNKFMNKVTLTGKINALHVAANLFEFTDKTAVVFDELKVELIEALLRENINKITNELSFKAKTAIDILVRNLFERTADVGFFSTDTLIIEFLTTDNIAQNSMTHYLQEYASKYSVYNEIVIFDTLGNVKAHLNEENLITKSKDSIIKDALLSDDYIERYTHTDIFKKQEQTLIYAQKITHQNKDIGVLCLCFKFDDELESIFNNLSHNNESMNISNKTEVLISNENKLYTPYNPDIYSIVKKKFIAVTKKASPYQGYSGVDGWYATAMLHTKNIVTVKRNEVDGEKRREKSTFLSEELQQIIEKANDIIEDIADVIINGELIASKQKVYLLTPILDNLRTISSALLISIKESLENLEYVVKEALIHDTKMASHLAIDIMDRNLYERANDSRWWALTPLFQEELASVTPNQVLLDEKLLYINELYTVYTNLFLFDENARIVASSKEPSIVGKQARGKYIESTLKNSNSQNYFVSEFENSSLYNDRPTYIYSASIVQNGKIVGGIGVVFDSEPEFKAILDDSFPVSKNGFMLFIDKNKKVIASNNPKIKNLSILKIDDKFVNEKSEHAVYDFISYEGEKYIVASTLSQGYREYKTEDNYVNNIYCLSYIKI